MTSFGPGGYEPTMMDWKQKRGKDKGSDIWQLPTDLFDALQIKDKSGKVLTASQIRPRGGLNTREMIQLFSMAMQEAHRLPSTIREKYGLGGVA